MTARIPERPSPFEAEGVPDPHETGEGQDVSSEAGSAYGEDPPGDTALAVQEFGTTAQEEHDGESLDGRLDREQPEVLAAAGTDADESEGSDTPFGERAGQGVGRLVEPDEGGRSDTESDLVATDEGTDLGGYTVEESAMHLETDS